MGLQRTPPPQSTASLLPRPIPPPYPTASSSGAQEEQGEASSSRVTVDVAMEDANGATAAEVDPSEDVVEETPADEEMVDRAMPVEAAPVQSVDAPAPPPSSAEPPAQPAQPRSSRRRTLTSNQPTAQPITSVPPQPADTVVQPPVTATKPSPPDTSIAVSSAEQPKDYGKHHRLLLQALEVAVRKGANKWTANDLKQCFPTISSAHPQAFDEIWAKAANALRDNMLDKSHAVLSSYQAGPALERFHDMIKSGVDADVEKNDAWQPDLDPAAAVSATKLPMFDAIYEELSTDYIELHAKAAAAAEELERKQARLKELREEAKDSAAQLDQTVQVLDGIPNEEMIAWMEGVVGTLGNGRS